MDRAAQHAPNANADRWDAAVTGPSADSEPPGPCRCWTCRWRRDRPRPARRRLNQSPGGGRTERHCLSGEGRGTHDRKTAADCAHLDEMVGVHQLPCAGPQQQAISRQQSVFQSCFKTENGGVESLPCTVLKLADDAWVVPERERRDGGGGPAEVEIRADQLDVGRPEPLAAVVCGGQPGSEPRHRRDGRALQTAEPRSKAVADGGNAKR